MATRLCYRHLTAGQTRFFSTSQYRLRTRPDILACRNTSFYKFGDPTSEPAKALFRDLSWRISDSTPNETASGSPPAWALIGPRSASLVDSALLGRARADPPSSRSWPFLRAEDGEYRPVEDAIKKVSFSTRLESKSYLAQPGQFTDYTARYYGIRADDEDAFTLRSHLAENLQDAEKDTEFLLQTAKSLKIDHLLDIPLVALSNGQTRRARIARAVLTRPEVLVLEEPFTGLDVQSRATIAELLGQMHSSRSPRIVLILRAQDVVPSWVDHVIEMSSAEVQTPEYIGPREAWKGLSASSSEPQNGDSIRRKLAADDAPDVYNLDRVNVGYKDRKVLKEISWVVKAGDRVALTGANGSGKSTLLSLVTGDHPASYSQNITLFDQPRSKHSVYSLSARTGHFSPELFSAFPRRFGESGLTIHEAIGTGFENVFSYRKTTPEQNQQIEETLDKLDPSRKIFTEHFLYKTLLAEASAPLQALALIVRAAAKKPDLLIMDEPFAGMDQEMIQQCRAFFDTQLEEHQTLLFISHYTEEWPATLGKRFHLEQGRGVESVL